MTKSQESSASLSVSDDQWCLQNKKRRIGHKTTGRAAAAAVEKIPVGVSVGLGAVARAFPPGGKKKTSNWCWENEDETERRKSREEEVYHPRPPPQQPTQQQEQPQPQQQKKTRHRNRNKNKNNKTRKIVKFQPSSSTGNPKRTRQPPRSNHNRRSRRKPAPVTRCSRTTRRRSRSRRRREEPSTHHEEDPDDYQDWFVVGNWAWVQHSNTTNEDGSVGNDTTATTVHQRKKRKRRQQQILLPEIAEEEDNGNDENEEEKRKEHEEQQWMLVFERLVEYRSETNHTRVPQPYATDRKLGIWVATQRANYQQGTLLPARYQKLTLIQFVWDVNNAPATRRQMEEQQWFRMYQRLRRYHQKYHTTRVHTKYSEVEDENQDTTETNLAYWVYSQRNLGKYDKLAHERYQLLEALQLFADADTPTTRASHDDDDEHKEDEQTAAVALFATPILEYIVHDQYVYSMPSMEDEDRRRATAATSSTRAGTSATSGTRRSETEANSRTGKRNQTGEESNKEAAASDRHQTNTRKERKTTKQKSSSNRNNAHGRNTPPPPPTVLPLNLKHQLNEEDRGRTASSPRRQQQQQQPSSSLKYEASSKGLLTRQPLPKPPESTASFSSSAPRIARVEEYTNEKGSSTSSTITGTPTESLEEIGLVHWPVGWKKIVVPRKNSSRGGSSNSQGGNSSSPTCIATATGNSNDTNNHNTNINTKKKSDPYWITPQLQYKLRSMVEVKQFLVALQQQQQQRNSSTSRNSSILVGDERLAKQIMKSIDIKETKQKLVVAIASPKSSSRVTASASIPPPSTVSTTAARKTKNPSLSTSLSSSLLYPTTTTTTTTTTNNDDTNNNCSELVEKSKKAAFSLWTLLHAKNCRLGVDRCSQPGCSEAKLMYLHHKTCPSQLLEPCPSQHKGCQDSRKLLAHYRRCRDIRARQSQNPTATNKPQQHVCLVCSLVARHAKFTFDRHSSTATKGASDGKTCHDIPSLSLTNDSSEDTQNRTMSSIQDQPRKNKTKKRKSVINTNITTIAANNIFNDSSCIQNNVTQDGEEKKKKNNVTNSTTIATTTNKSYLSISDNSTIANIHERDDNPFENSGLKISDAFNEEAQEMPDYSSYIFDAGTVKINKKKKTMYDKSAFIQSTMAEDGQAKTSAKTTKKKIIHHNTNTATNTSYNESSCIDENLIEDGNVKMAKKKNTINRKTDTATKNNYSKSSRSQNNLAEDGNEEQKRKKIKRAINSDTATNNNHDGTSCTQSNVTEGENHDADDTIVDDRPWLNAKWCWEQDYDDERRKMLEELFDRQQQQNDDSDRKRTRSSNNGDRTIRNRIRSTNGQNKRASGMHRKDQNHSEQYDRHDDDHNNNTTQISRAASIDLTSNGTSKTSKRKSQLKKPSSKNQQHKSWKLLFDRLVEYKRHHGHTMVPCQNPEDPKLGLWVKRQRERKDGLSPYRRDLLNKIEFEWKNVQSIKNKQSWWIMFHRLVMYKKKYRTTRVPKIYAEEDGSRLGRWVSHQRHFYNTNSLSDARYEMLDAIGFVWNAQTVSSSDVTNNHNDNDDDEIVTSENPPQKTWRLMFDKLVEYKTQHGNTLVPQHYTDDTELAQWVKAQRVCYKRGRLLKSRYDALNTIDFVWYVKHGDAGNRNDDGFYDDWVVGNWCLV